MGPAFAAAPCASGRARGALRPLSTFRPRAPRVITVRKACSGCSARMMRGGGSAPSSPLPGREDEFWNASEEYVETARGGGGKPSAPWPGREDEFSNANGESLEESSRVSTLDRDPEKSFDTVLQELVAIQQDGPRNVAILGTRYTSYLHQQIIELLTYANVLVGNHVFTSGAGGTNAAVIRGALRAEKPDLLTVVLPQSLHKQPSETQEQLKKVKNMVEMRKNDMLPLDIASQLCNSDILSRCSHFIAFAFHDSDVVLEAVRAAKELRIVVTVLYLD